MALPLLGLAGKGLSALGKRRAARKAAQAQTGKQVAQNITGRKQGHRSRSLHEISVVATEAKRI